MCRHPGVHRQGKGQEDLRRRLLRRRQAAGRPGFHQRDQPHPAPLQADDRRGVCRRAAAPERHGQAAAEIIGKAPFRQLHFRLETGIIKDG